jgi:methionyl-tRNA formyltransferase
LNIVFMGSPEFAVPCMERLITDNHNILAVVTQTDKPQGRGNIISASPVKKAAIKNNIRVIQPESLRDEKVAEMLTDIAPDLIVVVAYGKILTKRILETPAYGCVNIHASLLPKYRGAAPIQWALINGETQTGITSMLMDEGLDTGNILLSEKTYIDQNENSGNLFSRMSEIGAGVLSRTVYGIANKTIIPVIQDDTLSSYAPPIRKTICRIDWSQSSISIHNLIRGLSPFLSATTTFNGKIIKIISSSLCEPVNGTAGEVVENSNKLRVVCGNNTAIELKILQTQGKRAMPADEFLRGNRIKLHQLLI